MKHHGKYRLFCIILLIMLLTLISCGLRENPESVSVAEDEGEPVPVAEFHDMRLPGALDFFWRYTFSEDWLYCTARKTDDSETTIQEMIRRNVWVVYRNGIYDMFDPEVYFEREGGLPMILLVDRESNFFMFCQDDNGEFSLEKYDADGAMQWHKGYAASELQNLGNSIGEGIVTADGRVFLHTYGKGGKIVAFGTDGELQKIYTPDVEALEGIVEGRDGQVYGYCVTGDIPVFVELGDTCNQFECPIVPLQVFGGREDGVYLCTGEGMWKYEPISGETERMWAWNDEYVQIDGAHINQIFRGEEDVRLLCMEHYTHMWGTGEVLTFVSVTPKERRDYPVRQEVTISRALIKNPGSHMEDMVRQYNRQNSEYRVVILPPEEDSSANSFIGALQLQLLRGEGPDLINVLGLNVNSLADKGAFEELSEYYEASDRVKEGDIFEAVREAGKVGGKEVMVIPTFVMETMMTREEVDEENWTPLRFLELTQYGALYDMPMSQMSAFEYCLGARPQEYFIDYEKKECYFDSEDIKNLLMECNKWEQQKGADEKKFFNTYIWGADSFVQMKKDNGFYLGRPGWNGAENIFNSSDVFVINSASKNKQGAWDFLEFLLSEEMQERIDWNFPVRIDSFEKYLSLTASWTGGDRREFSYYVSSIPQMEQEDIATFRRLIDNAVFRDSTVTAYDNPVRTILREEAEMYFAGDATLDETIDKIQSRVQWYLNE